MLRKLWSPLILLILWEAISLSGLIDRLILPPPTAIFVEIKNLVLDGSLLSDLFASLRRIFGGFMIAVVVSVALGSLMAYFRVVEDALDPLVELVRPVSPLAIFPLALLWFGIGDASKIFLIALSCSFPVILNTYAGVRGVDPALLRVSRSLGASSREILLKVVLRGSLPQIFTGIRLAWGIALIVIIAAEMIGGNSGLGYMVLNAQQTFRVDRVFAGIMVIGVLGFVTDIGLRHVRRRMLPWYQESEGT